MTVVIMVMITAMIIARVTIIVMITVMIMARVMIIVMVTVLTSKMGTMGTMMGTIIVVQMVTVMLLQAVTWSDNSCSLFKSDS